MLVSIVLVAVCFASSTVVTASGLHKPSYDLENAENLFREFVKQYGKAYDRREYFERLEIFKGTLENINMRNEKYPMTVFKVNHFADLRPEEMEQYKGLKLSNETTINKVTVPRTLMDVPDEFDWRNKGVLSRVKNQHLNCSSCVVFSSVGNIEAQYAIKHKECLALSEGQVLDCFHGGSCYGGSMYWLIKEISETSGVMKEADYPYTPYKGECKEDPKKVAVRVLDSQLLDITDEDSLRYLIIQLGPLSIGMNCDDFYYYHGGILQPNTCTGMWMDHAALLVGYGEENGIKFWIIKNSWGNEWGEMGYVRLLRGVKACLITDFVVSSTVA